MSTIKMIFGNFHVCPSIIQVVYFRKKYILTAIALLNLISFCGGVDHTPLALASLTFSWLLLLTIKYFASLYRYLCTLGLSASAASILVFEFYKYIGQIYETLTI